MKRLQNPRIMDDDRINMEDIEHWGEDEDVTTIENNPNKKEKEERIKKMLTKAMATFKLLAKNLFEIFLFLNDNLAFSYTSNYGSDCGEWLKAHMLCNLYLSIRRLIWTSIFFNKALVSTNYCNNVVLFSAMVEKCQRHWSYAFCFVL